MLSRRVRRCRCQISVRCCFSLETTPRRVPVDCARARPSALPHEPLRRAGVHASTRAKHGASNPGACVWHVHAAFAFVRTLRAC